MVNGLMNSQAVPLLAFDHFGGGKRVEGGGREGGWGRKTG